VARSPLPGPASPRYRAPSAAAIFGARAPCPGLRRSSDASARSPASRTDEARETISPLRSRNRMSCDVNNASSEAGACRFRAPARGQNEPRVGVDGTHPPHQPVYARNPVAVPAVEVRCKATDRQMEVAQALAAHSTVSPGSVRADFAITPARRWGAETAGGRGGRTEVGNPQSRQLGAKPPTIHKGSARQQAGSP